MTAEVIPADEARRIGLVHEVVVPDQIDAARDRILASLFQGAPGAQADAKDLVFTVDRPLTDEIMAETGRRIALRRASDEGREGIGAFLAKRNPAWRQ
jgi:methylglutaconyl-CoA hydratase